MRVTILAVNLLLCIISLYLSLRNGFDRAASSTWLFIFITLAMAINIRGFWLRRHGNISRQKPKYNGPEKRSFYRVVYSPNRRPWVVIKDLAFEVTDISQKGLGFLNHKDVMLGGEIEGRVTFTDGDSIDIVGKIGWKKAGQTSLDLSNTIPHSFIKKELSHFA